MFKAPLTAIVVANFLSNYQSLSSTPQKSNNSPFVYVDQNCVKLVTNVVGEGDEVSDGIFALSMGHDGWVEMLALQEHEQELES